MVADTNYDADSRIFSFKVQSKDPSVGDIAAYNFTVGEKLSADAARNFDKKLSTTAPQVFFSLTGGKLAVERAEVKVDNKVYAAAPSGETAAVAEVVDLGKLSSVAAISPGALNIAARIWSRGTGTLRSWKPAPIRCNRYTIA